MKIDQNVSTLTKNLRGIKAPFKLLWLLVCGTTFNLTKLNILICHTILWFLSEH